MPVNNGVLGNRYPETCGYLTLSRLTVEVVADPDDCPSTHTLLSHGALGRYLATF